MEEFDALRNRLDEGQRIYNAEKRGIEIGREIGIKIGEQTRLLELIKRWYSEGKTVQETVELLEKNVSEIELILESENLK